MTKIVSLYFIKTLHSANKNKKPIKINNKKNKKVGTLSALIK